MTSIIADGRMHFLRTSASFILYLFILSERKALAKNIIFNNGSKSDHDRHVWVWHVNDTFSFI